LRRLTPIEAERLNGFPDDWTLTEKMPLNFRYFCMGNALVVPLVAEIMKGIKYIS
jgi:DNA (cytosine-5)-methyltransferase 1